MTIKYLAGNMITGLAVDTKPTLVASGSRYLETDTNQEFIWSGSAWVEKQAYTPYSYTIYKAGTTVKAKNNITGNVDYTGDSNVNCSTTIQSAVENIAKLGSDDATGYYGGGVFIMKGTYKCTTTISLDSTVTGVRQGISLEGERRGTVLYFQPGSSLSHGILAHQNQASVSNMTIRANANLISLLTGIATQEMHCMNLRVSDITFEGPNAYPYGNWAPVEGQIGILQDGVAAAQPYWWKITGCTFHSLKYGIYSKGNNGTSMQISSCDFWDCEIGIGLVGAAEHIINNIWIQGDTNYGTTGIRIGGTSSINHIYQFA